MANNYMRRSGFEHILKEGYIFKITLPQVKTANISTPGIPCQTHAFFAIRIVLDIIFILLLLQSL